MSSVIASTSIFLQTSVNTKEENTETMKKRTSVWFWHVNKKPTGADLTVHVRVFHCKCRQGSNMRPREVFSPESVTVSFYLAKTKKMVRWLRP